VTANTIRIVYRDWFQQCHHKKQWQKQIKTIVHTPNILLKGNTLA
jgi:hypothetical protein